MSIVGTNCCKSLSGTGTQPGVCKLISPLPESVETGSEDFQTVTSAGVDLMAPGSNVFVLAALVG